MIETIKSWTIKIGAVLAPLLGMLAYIFLLKRENTQLKDSIAVEKAKEELGKVLDEKAKEETVATGAQSDYQSVRDAYLRGHNMPSGDPTGGQSPSGKE